MKLVRIIIQKTKTIVLAVFVAVAFVPAFLFSNNVVPTQSMMPTILPGDNLIVNRIPYYGNDPEALDIVVFKENDDYIIKRVIGKPGDIIDLKDGYVYVNNVKLDERVYLKAMGKTYANADSKIQYPFTVSENCYFVLGDNREKSNDSRVLGEIKRENIIARAEYRIYPLDRWGNLEKPESNINQAGQDNTSTPEAK